MSLLATLRGLHGNKVRMVIEELHRSENDLAGALLNISDVAKTDHEIFHVARDIARWSQEHVRRLAVVGRDYGVELDPEPEDESTLLARLKQKGSELAGRRPEPSLMVLAELRHVHKMAAGVSVDWEVLAQTAQAMTDQDLLSVAQDCHPQTLRQLRWANAKIKEMAAQVIVAG